MTIRNRIQRGRITPTEIRSHLSMLIWLSPSKGQMLGNHRHANTSSVLLKTKTPYPRLHQT